MTKAAASHSGPYTANELEAMKSSRRQYRDGMPFGTLVAKFLEPLEEIKRSSGQRTHPFAKRKNRLSPDERRWNVISDLIKETSDRGGDMYPVIRLVAPELDIESGPFNIKEKTMAKILPRALGFYGKYSADRIRLAEWGPETQDEDGRHIPFIGICQDVIESRISSKSSTVTVDWVCALLDQLRLETKEDNRVQVLSDMSCGLTPGELTWVMRIILDDVHLAVNYIFIHKWHDRAAELMMSRSCLRLVCWELDGSSPAGTRWLGVQPSRCFQPQLASRQVRETDGTLKHLLRKTVGRLGMKKGQPFHVEEKLDGERMQVHVAVDEDGKMHFRWWSRQGVDYTHKYGSSESEGTLARHISGALALRPAGQAPLTSLILDGEMVVWDSTSDKIQPHITHSPIAYHGPFIWPLFRAFDVLYCNGMPLTKYALDQRHKVMSLYIVGVANRFEWHRGTSATTVEELEVIFVNAMIDGHEGLVVKSLSSTYQPGARPNSWMKLKPEYSSEYGRPLHCVIIGRSYGRGQNSGKLTRLLCGIREGDESGRWLSFCGLGSGISSAVRDEIDMRTNGKWKSWGDGAAASEFIKLGPAGYEAPDQWIVPDQSVVISVKAAAISTSRMYASGTGLLHPRFDQLPDMDPSQALSMADVEAIESVRDIRSAAAAASKKPAKPYTGGKFLILAGLHSSAAMATPAENYLFANKSFFIGAACEEPDLSKDEMVVMVRRNGGQVFYHGHKSDYFVSDKLTGWAWSRKRSGKDDIIHPRWLVKCVEQQRVVELDEADHVRFPTRNEVRVISDDDDDDSFEPVKPR